MFQLKEKQKINSLSFVFELLHSWPSTTIFHLIFMIFNVPIFVDCYHPYQNAISSWNRYIPNPSPQVIRKFTDQKSIMVDVVNNLGLKLLAIHNENNENNIALSPYGALSVLIALGEGVQGEAVREIQQSANIPNDISVIRVGLRDIHRHLKTYFIPKEGFLAGLTLNHDNVTLMPDYEEILRYYGYDIMAFNNAFFPEKIDRNEPTEQPGTSPFPVEGATMEKTPTTISIITSPEVPTIISVGTTAIAEVPSIVSISVGTTQSTAATANFIEEIQNSTVAPPQLTEGYNYSKPEEVTGYSENRPDVPVDLTTKIMEIDSTEKMFTTPPPVRKTTSFTPTTAEVLTTPISVTTETQFTTVSTAALTTPTPGPTTTPFTATAAQTSTTPLPETVTTPFVTVTEQASTMTTVALTTILDTVTNSEIDKTTTEASSKLSEPRTPETFTTTTLPITTSAVITSTENASTTERGIPSTVSTLTTQEVVALGLKTTTTTGFGGTDTTTNIFETTNLKGETTTEQAPTALLTETTYRSTSEEASLSVISTSEAMNTILQSLSSSLFEQVPTTEESITSFSTAEEKTTFLPNSSDCVQKESDNEALSTDYSEGFAGAIRSSLRKSSVNLVELNFIHSKPSKRKSRSLLDYALSRYYDSTFDSRPHQRPYVPIHRPSFLLYGKYREFNINFMRYDTVLPFYYVPHLNTLALRFPLDNTNYYLLLLLPVDEHGIDQLICNLRFNGSLRYIIRNLRYQHVVATIPSFKLKGYVSLTPTFQRLGIRRVFEPRQADFTPMTNEKGIYVTNIEQAITVNIRNYVDPNSPEMRRDLRQYTPVEFKADHPFLYFVMDSELQVTLMAGKVINPINSRIR